ncbi:potassium channel family protein [Neptuniibacter halophilus]|uniref:potassium channel family protein n=1 Tax=Neptuniibacter halophilus TaxID=651666 RepID=UPI002572F225|nr:potassium channel family protein [Neptuniibacter halophilus]
MEYQKHAAFMRLFGLGGVDESENERALRWGRRFEGPMVIAAVWILVEWYLQSKNLSNPYASFASDWLIWLLFASELALMLSLVDDRLRYLKQNWMSPLIVLGGLPVLWGVNTFYAGIIRSLRLALTIGVFLRVSKDTRDLLSRHNLGITLFICFIILVISGLLISGIDPAFESPMDGLWWAWVTVTTVGYGDLVPETTEGRIFGSLLILMGLGMFSMLTASFSVFFIEQDEREITEKEEENILRIEQLENRLERIENQLDKALEVLNKLDCTSRTPQDPVNAAAPHSAKKEDEAP